MGRHMRYFGRLSFRGWLIFLGISALLALLLPELAIVAAISIIGIPIALFLAMAPGLFIIFFFPHLISKFLGGGWISVGVGLVVTLGVLAIVPYIANMPLEKRAIELVATDHDSLTPPIAVGILGVRSTNGLMGFGRDTTPCDEFCARALLNGQTKQLLFSVDRDTNAVFDLNAKAVSFRMEDRPQCPEVKLADGYGNIRVDGEDRGFTAKRPHELMKLAIAKGHCLIQEEAVIGLADVILSNTRLNNGVNAYRAGLDPFADTVSADRLSVHIRDGGGYRETFRWTGVTIHKLAPLLIPTINSGYGLEADAGFLRFTERKNIADKYYERPDWSRFLTKTLGMDLALRDSSVDADTRLLLETALAQDGSLTASSLSLTEDYFDRFMRARTVSKEDAALALRLLSDRRFEIPRTAWAAVEYAKDVGPDYFEGVARVMFEWLRETTVWDGQKIDHGQTERAKRIGGIIHRLPATALLTHRQDLEWLAREQALRVPAYQALQRLSELGADAAPTLLYLIDDAAQFRGKKKTMFDSNTWQHPYLAGIQGLCLMREPVKTLVQPIYERLDAGTIVKFASYWRLVINTLVAHGANPDDMWLHLQSDDKNMTRERFDFEVARAQEKRDCGY